MKVADFLLAGAVLLVSTTAAAQTNGVPKTLENVGIEQRLGAAVPQDLVFQDHEGKTVDLESLDTGRPVILAMVYYECPMLCTMVLNGLLRSLNVMKLDVGKDFDIITVSIDPNETPALALKKREKYLHKYRRESAAEGWHFLVGDQTNVKALADAVGFHYAWDESIKQYAHASAVIVLTPEGTVSKYLYGIDYSPTILRLALVEASRGDVGSLADVVLLYCFQYDPSTGRYSLAIMNVLRAAAVATVLGLLVLIGTYLVRDRRRHAAERLVAS